MSVNPDCEICDGDGYTERFNDDQTDVIITLCNCDEVRCKGCGQWTDIDLVDDEGFCRECEFQ